MNRVLLFAPDHVEDLRRKASKSRSRLRRTCKVAGALPCFLISALFANLDWLWGAFNAWLASVYIRAELTSGYKSTVVVALLDFVFGIHRIAWVATRSLPRTPLRVIDFSPRITIASIGTFVFFGFGIWTWKSVDLVEVFGGAFGVQQESLSGQREVRQVYPVGTIPVFWKRNSDRELIIGLDGSPGPMGQFGDLCAYSHIVVLGLASADGPDEGNRRLSRSRAEHLAAGIARQAKTCAGKGLYVLPVAMRSPVAERGDGTQRMALAFGLKTLTPITPQEILERAVASNATLRTFTVVEFCQLSREQGCDWTA